MLRVVLTIDCDRCKQSYWQAAVSNDPESLLWESLASDLQDCAGGDGWRVGEKIGEEIVCDECVEVLEREVAALSGVGVISPFPSSVCVGDSP